jgi:ankyrin repeat protein
MDKLQVCHRRHDLEDQLKILPHDLDELYDRVISSVDEVNRNDVFNILQWLAFAVRPLRLAEIAQVIGVVPDSDQGLRFEPSRVFPDPRSVLMICSSLVTEIDGEYSKRNYNRRLTDPTGNVKLSHMSVKDYLLSKCHKVQDTVLTINEKLSHSLIAQTCLAYLLQFNTLDIWTWKRVRTYPLIGYAAQFWISHVQSGEDEWTDTQRKLVMALFRPQHTAPFISWTRFWDIDNRVQSFQRISADIPSPLYYASFIGLLPAVEALIKDRADVNAEGGYYGHSLQAASCKGYGAIVDMLLENGADVNAQGGYYGTALQAASSRGHEEIMGLLLKKGADVNIQGGYYGSALQAASYKGHEAAVGLLLENGADVNAQGGQYGTSLNAASLQGRGAIVGLLLRRADVTVQGGYFGNALQAASYNGHETIVHMLLENGADVNAQGGEYSNALQAASSKGHKTIVAMLLEKGADVNTQGGIYGSAIQAALFCNHEAIVELLLEKGADATAQRKDFL